MKYKVCKQYYTKSNRRKVVQIYAKTEIKLKLRKEKKGVLTGKKWH